MYALAQAEYLFLVRKNLLPPPLRKKLRELRQTIRSGGLDDSGSVPTIGYHDGIQGYQEAVRYVYGLFNEPMDSSAEDHVSSLWTACLGNSGSTFSALHMSCYICFIEVGNVGGYRFVPF